MSGFSDSPEHFGLLGRSRSIKSRRAVAMEGALEGSNNEAGGPACPQPECMAAPVTPPTPSPLLENARSDMREDSPQSSREPTQLAERRTSKIGYIGAAFTSIGSVGTVYVNQTLRKAQTYAVGIPSSNVDTFF